MPYQTPRKLEIKVVEFDDLPARPELQTLYQYWGEKRGARAYPCWQDIDLMALYPVASIMLVKDVIDGGKDYYNRFWGSGLTRLTGFDGGHRLHSELYKDAPEGPVTEPYERVLAAKKPVLVTRNSWFIANYEHTNCELLHVPIGEERTSLITHIITVCVAIKAAPDAIKAGVAAPERPRAPGL
jgi:hypothetical protein